MAYTIPTVSDLNERYPSFLAVDDLTIQLAIDDATRMVDTSWTEGDYATAIILYACHLMALDGLGTSPDAQANTGQAANFQTIRSGQLTLTRGSSASSGEIGSEGWYNSTRFGRRFWMLLKQNRGGARVAVSNVAGYHPAAFDWPYPWPY